MCRRCGSKRAHSRSEPQAVHVRKATDDPRRTKWGGWVVMLTGQNSVLSAKARSQSLAMIPWQPIPKPYTTLTHATPRFFNNTACFSVSLSQYHIHSAAFKYCSLISCRAIPVQFYFLYFMLSSWAPLSHRRALLSLSNLESRLPLVFILSLDSCQFNLMIWSDLFSKK